MASSFQPDPGALSELVQVLRHADSTSTEAQRQVVQQLEHFSSTVPSFPAYLAYIFALAQSESENVRLRAGLSLKNSVTDRVAAFPPDVLEYVKQTVFVALEDNSGQIRNTASSVIDWLFRTLGPSNWPEAIARLLDCLNSPNAAVQESAYKAIANISRQSPRVLADLTYNGSRPLDSIMPILIHNGLTSPSANVRATALSALNPFIVSQPPILLQNMQHFLQNMFSLTSDSSPKVRKGVVESMNTLLSFWPEQIVPHIEPVINYMLYCLDARESDEDTALTAAEFLLTFTEEPDLYEQLQLHLEKFLPGLLQAIAFTESSREVLDMEDDDYQKEDKASDIKPHIHKSRTVGSSTRVPSLAARMGMTADDVAAAANGGEGGHEDEADGEEEEEDEDDPDTLWTVRRAASRALETAAETFEGALLEILLPEVTRMLSQGDWFQREAAIHALGNVATGCSVAMYDHLPSLVPFLLQSLNDQNPLIRSSAAWTLGEYSPWIADSINTDHSILLNTVQGLLTVALDNNKNAQGNAIRAFGLLAKQAGSTGALQPYLASIVQAFVAAFAKYQSRNILKLYDAIAQLSDAGGLASLNDENLLGSLMPPLIERWQAFGDDDPNLLYLLECLTSLVVAAGPGFKPYADPVLQRAYRIIHSSLYQYQLYQADPHNLEKPDKAWLVVSLDLISSLVQALGQDATAPLAPFVSQSDAGQLPMLLVCSSSTFALIGDLAGKAIDSLYPVLGQLLPTIAESISPEPRLATASMESNAIWAVGELAMSLGSQMEPYVPALLDRMQPILASIKASSSLLENAAVTIGRLALASPASVAPRLPTLLRIWSQTMTHVSKGSEQDSALQGICLAVQANPAGVQDNGRFLAEALALCDNPSPELQRASAMARISV